MKDTNQFSLPFFETLTPTSYSLPENLTAEQWLDVGRALGRIRGSTMWWIGDWWAYGEHRYGERANAVRSDDWEGPAFGTCVNAGVVCRKFESQSRDGVVSFRIHQAIAPIPDDTSRFEVLAWAATPDSNGRRPIRSVVEERVKQVRAQLAQGWTPDQRQRKAAAEAGQCVVANMRDQDGRRADEALLSWAEATDKFVRIDRQSDWGNPFVMPDDGERDEVVTKFERFYWPQKNKLLSRASSLRGKVLGCWCHPEQCHGHVIADTVNAEADGKGTAAEIAEQFAEFEG